MPGAFFIFISMKPGDLVQFVQDPLVTERSIIPVNDKPYGIIIELFDRRIGDEIETQAIMKLARVYWFAREWNSKSGLSEEHPADLRIIQSL